MTHMYVYVCAPDAERLNDHTLKPFKWMLSISLCETVLLDCTTSGAESSYSNATCLQFCISIYVKYTTELIQADGRIFVTPVT